MKRLSRVDATRKSNQHEIGPTKAMREQFLGQEKQTFPAVYVWLGEDQDGFTFEAWATHYDAREAIPGRSEWRLYYPSNAVTEAMSEGDTLFLARHHDGTLWFIVAPAGSTSEQQLFWLFGIRPQGELFVSREVSDTEPALDFAARFILEELGIEFEEPDAVKLDTIIERFGTTFPTTATFSQLARLTVPEIRAEDDPDAALMAWLDHEEAMFRRLERRIVSERLEAGFTGDSAIDVDGFLKFSLSVQNRRKSRMGHSLEHHLAAILDACGIRHERGAVTEDGNRPDFLFPDQSTYHAAPPEGLPKLAMLGAKSTCKDRWRQVLAEAAKIDRKHLLTLEPGISEPQTVQMEARNLQLVVPQPVHASYNADQQGWLWNLAAFIDEMRRRQVSL
ncbi:type II restriction endonuclease [uncultured Jannaschia sp.]|uniref:type II restriction endonuclease n=1 Tax=uncultured Jannaschia sp. TaxID=293347 RepID=UPI0026041DD3|nr:type II restriction endonuclease [uncultured Jannaschia sp.]